MNGRQSRRGKRPVNGNGGKPGNGNGGKPGNGNGGKPGNGNGHGAVGRLRDVRPADLMPPANPELGPPFVLPTGDSVRQVAVPGDAQRPVFVLTMARSGSTLLRVILDGCSSFRVS
jgi:hypothetical protein